MCQHRRLYLPQDILGYTRIDSATSNLVFTRGPIFAHFVLCDEINLLTPKTQGSFFQAMEEQTVTIEGRTYHLEDPFFIISTMNLKGAHLFPLPAPQLDRFMVQLSMGYPNTSDEISIVNQHGRDDGWGEFKPVIKAEDIIEWRNLVDQEADFEREAPADPPHIDGPVPGIAVHDVHVYIAGQEECQSDTQDRHGMCAHAPYFPPEKPGNDRRDEADQRYREVDHLHLFLHLINPSECQDR